MARKSKQIEKEKSKKPTLSDLKDAAYKAAKSSNSSNAETRYHIITGYEISTPVHNNFVRALRMLSQSLDAELLFTPVNKHVGALQEQPTTEYLTVSFPDSKLVREYRFHENLKLYDMRVPSQNSNPLNGLKKIREHHRDSVIVGHSQIMMDHVPTGLNTPPRMLASTGVCTVPEYIRNIQGMKAAQNHTLGALLIENVGNGCHLTYTIYWNEENQSLWVYAQRPHDCAKVCWEFNPNYELPKRGYANSLVCGDMHVDDICSTAWRLTSDMIINALPQHVFVHDFLSYHHGHHNERFKSSQIHLPEHINTVYKNLMFAREMFYELHEITQSVGSQIVMVPSNHHEHIAQTIDTGAYQNKQGEDYLLLNELCYFYHNHGIHPLKQLLDPNGEMAFWDCGTKDLRIMERLFNCHGDRGANGSRGSFKQLVDLYMKVVLGHYHRHMIMNNGPS